METKSSCVTPTPDVQILKTANVKKRGRPSDDSLPVAHKARVAVRKLWMDCKTKEDILLVQELREIVERDTPAIVTKQTPLQVAEPTAPTPIKETVTVPSETTPTLQPTPWKPQTPKEKRFVELVAEYIIQTTKK